MAFTINITDSVAIDPSKRIAYETAFLTANLQANVMDALAVQKSVPGAEAIKMSRYTFSSTGDGAIAETDDATSTKVESTAVLFVPEERAVVATISNLSSLVTGGQIDLAAPTVVGNDFAGIRNRLAGKALDASSNVLTANGGLVADIAATDILTGALMNKAYNKLARANVKQLGNFYVIVAHDDVIADLRADASVGSWTDVNKYATPGTVLTNEVGTYKGFRVIRNNDATITADAGAGAVDVYNSYVLGYNGLGYAESMTPELRLRDGNDKIGRFYNLSAYGVFKYGIVDPEAAWVIKSASSLGANA